MQTTATNRKRQRSARWRAELPQPGGGEAGAAGTREPARVSQVRQADRAAVRNAVRGHASRGLARAARTAAGQRSPRTHLLVAAKAASPAVRGRGGTRRSACKRMCAAPERVRGCLRGRVAKAPPFTGVQLVVSSRRKLSTPTREATPPPNRVQTPPLQRQEHPAFRMRVRVAQPAS